MVFLFGLCCYMYEMDVGLSILELGFGEEYVIIDYCVV